MVKIILLNIICIFLVTLSVNCYGQNCKVIDSLESLLSSSICNRNEIECFNILYDLAFEYRDINDLTKAFEYGSEASIIAFKCGDSLKIVKSGRMKGQILRSLDRTIDAINQYLRVLPIAKRNSINNELMENEEKYLLNSLAIAYTLIANYDKALEYNFKSLVLREVEGNREDISVSLNNIGLVYFKIKNYDKALDYYRRCLDCVNLLPDKEFKDRLLINIGLCYNELGEFKKAQKYIYEALSFCRGNCDDVTLMEAEFGLGVSFLDLNKFKISKPHFSNSYKLARKINNKRYQIENLLCLAKIHSSNNETDSAESVLKLAEVTAVGTEYNHILIEIYKEFSNLYSHSTNFEMAARYKGKYIELRDRIFGDELMKNLAKIQTDYEQRANTAKLTSQNKILALKEQVISRQRKINYLAGGASFLLLVLVSLLYFNNSQSKKANALLEQKVKERTQALEDSYSTIQKAFTEQSLVVSRATNDIKEPLTSLQGLCNIAIREVQASPTKQYMVQIENTVGGLADTILKISVRNG